MTIETKTTVRLGDLGATHLWFSSVGSPTGLEIDLRADPGSDFGLAEEVWDAEGSIDEHGRWQWDGEGDLRDFRLNTIYSLTAWIDNDSEVDYGD